jgi:hypothetical protein
LNYERFNKSHYDFLKGVWTKYGWKACPLSFLPKIGYVAFEDKFIGAMFMYAHGGSVSMVDWAVANPEATKEQRAEAMRGCFDRLVELARGMDCTFIYSVTAVPAYMNLLKSFGMKEAERNMTSFVMSLNNEDMSFLD